MIGYITLGTNDFARASAFYDGLLAPLGAKRMMEIGDYNGGFILWGVGMDKPGIALTTPHDGAPAHHGNGHMAALVVAERAQVDAVHAKAIALGGRCEGPPGLPGDEGPQAFYAAYFRDLDGNKLCAYRMGPA